MAGNAISDQRSAISDQRSAISDQRSAIRAGRRALLWCAGLCACVFVLAAARSARAVTITQVTTGPDCELPYNPYTHETATPHASYYDQNASTDYSYLCSLDEDHDGLDDHIENVIAKCFDP